MIEIKEERFEDVVEELKEITVKHWEEIARNKDKIELNPDWNKYIEIEKSGILQTITCRDDERLVGYCIDIYLPHIHYKDHKFSMNDVLFLRKEYRGAHIGAKLLLAVELGLKEKGVDVVHMHVKCAHDFGPLLERIGYQQIEKIYEKVI